MKAFVSYSHRDDWARERLHTHLEMLRRDGQINDWYDREILAGIDIDEEISEQLESCRLFLPLVSPDFLASRYCYEREMMRALERHDAGEVRVVPIIIEPCDWTNSPLKKLKALPRNGKPIVEWTNHNTAFLDVVTELRRVVAEGTMRPGDACVPPRVAPITDGRRYRVKRDFDEIDRSDFREAAFNEIHRYFESAVAEVDGIEGLRGRFVPVGPQSFTCTVINRAIDRGTAHITVHARTESLGFGDIFYSFSANAPPNTMNGGFSIESDEYDLFLRPNMFIEYDDRIRVTAIEAARMLWSKFLEQAGVSHD